MLYHIQQGDLYEANFCMEFYAENAIIDPLDKFQTQRNFSTSICCVFLKQPPILLSASPERYLKKKENFLFHNL
jgi:para-aminobenzoate synthetase component 1